jgi:hypothetical protein
LVAACGLGVITYFCLFLSHAPVYFASLVFISGAFEVLFLVTIQAMHQELYRPEECAQRMFKLRSWLGVVVAGSLAINLSVANSLQPVAVVSCAGIVGAALVLIVFAVNELKAREQLTAPRTGTVT